MKKVITTLALALIMVAGTNAQIKKPTVKVNTTPIATSTKLQGVKVNDLSRLKTIEDFEKLNIPVQQMTKEKLNAKPTQTWKISPMHLIDGSLKLFEFLGSINPELFYFYGTYANYFNGETSNPRSQGGSNNFPLRIKFKASGGVEYRLKLKLRGGDGNNDKIYIYKQVKDTYYLTPISDQGNKEFNYVFKEDTSETVFIGISSIIKESEKFNRPFYSWIATYLSEIRIDRIN